MKTETLQETDKKWGRSLSYGFLLSVPSSLLLFVILFDFVPVSEFAFGVGFLAFATGLPWNLITIPFWLLGGDAGVIALTLGVHFLSSTVNGMFLYKLLTLIPIEGKVARVTMYITGSLLILGLVTYYTFDLLGF